MNASLEEIAQSFERDGLLVAPNLFLREEVRQEDGGDGSRKEMLDATGVYVGLAGRSGLFRQAVRDERLLDILEAILGPMSNL